MKKSVLLLVLLVVFTGFSAAQPEPVVTLEKVDPQPAEPGDTVKLFITVENRGDREATFDPVSVETVEGFRFTGTTSFDKSFELCGGCQKTGVLYLKVDENTVSGTYPVDVTATTGGTGAVGKFEVDVDGEPRLVTSSEGFRLSADDNTSLKFQVENVGTDRATQAVIRFQDGKLLATPSEISLGTIEPGEKARKSVNIRSDKNLAAGVRELPLEISYNDESSRLTRETAISGEVIEKAEIAVSDLDVSGATVGKEIDTVVQLENLGPGEAESIVSTLECENADVVSRRSFVGQLDDEESVPVSFKLVPRDKKVECSISVGYTDSSERSLEQSFSFPADRKSSVLPFVLVGILALAGLVLYWRKRREDELEEI